jgi:hypothetical protein
MTLNYIAATVTLITIAVFDTIAVLAIPLVALLTPLSVL